MIEQKKPIEEKHKDNMNAIAGVLDELFNPDGKQKVGFSLLIFPFNRERGEMNYISNAQRKEMLIAMKEFIASCEGRKYEENKNIKQ